MNPRATDRLRSVALSAVLRAWGARPDRHDPRKWHTNRGTLSISGPKFYNWSCARGGGGAIDLVIHLGCGDFPEALRWLQRHFPQHIIQHDHRSAHDKRSLRLPPPVADQLWRVKRYLLDQRAIPSALIDCLVATGALYADWRANAVFLLRDRLGHCVGAELRGTTQPQWRGMAPGSRKDRGFFSIGEHPAQHQPIILCESAIDAVSALALYPGHRCISTSGARPDPEWLQELIQPDVAIYCGFDADPTGQRMAQAMMTLHPRLRRLRPSFGDWNDQLQSRS